MAGFIALLKSPRFALAVIALLAAYTGVFAWAPWSLPGGGPPPGWAFAVGLDHPFSAPLFLVQVALLFASTLACTWGKRARTLKTQRGELPPAAATLPAREGADVAAFLASQGFHRRGAIWTRHRAGLWGGWVLHVGLLALIAGVLVQQAFHESGLFELAEGENVRLRGEGALLQRERGVFAPAEPPDLEVRLQVFDPFAREPGYAPDRRSQIIVARPDAEQPEVATLARDVGERIGGVKMFHAIPTGLALVVDVPGAGRRAVHLKRRSDHEAAAELLDPAGRPARFLLTTERRVDDPLATGAMLIELQQPGSSRRVAMGEQFRFGDADAKLIGVTRWAQLSYTRTPGMFGVFAGFVIVLLGCLLLTLPAGVACPGEGEVAARVYQPRGNAALTAEWSRFPPS